MVPVEPAAPAPPPAWTRLNARMTWAGAAAPPVGAAGALVAAPMAASAAARAPPPASTCLSARHVLAAALILLGCAVVGLFFATILLPAVQGKPLASEHLLLAASTPQALPLPAPAPAALAEPELPPGDMDLAPSSAPQPRLEPEHPWVKSAPTIPPMGPPAARVPLFVPSAGSAAAVSSSLFLLGLAMGLLV